MRSALVISAVVLLIAVGAFTVAEAVQDETWGGPHPIFTIRPTDQIVIDDRGEYPAGCNARGECWDATPLAGIRFITPRDLLGPPQQIDRLELAMTTSTLTALRDAINTHLRP